jgi:hypothetical protein
MPAAGDQEALQAKARSMSLQLEHDWTFYFDEGPPRGITKKEYQSYIKPLGSFNSIQVYTAATNKLLPIAHAGKIALGRSLCCSTRGTRRSLFAGLLAVLELDHGHQEAAGQCQPSAFQNRNSAHVGRPAMR